MIEVVEYVDDEDWEGGADEDEMVVVEVMERSVSVGDLKRQASFMVIDPSEVGIIGQDELAVDSGTEVYLPEGDWEEGEAFVVQPFVHYPGTRPTLSRQSSIYIAPHEVGIGGEEVVIESTSTRHLVVPDENDAMGSQEEGAACMPNDQYGHNGLSLKAAKHKEEQLSSEIAEIERKIVKAKSRRRLSIPKDEEKKATCTPIDQHGHNGLSPKAAKARGEQLETEIAEIQRKIVKAKSRRSLSIPKDEGKKASRAPDQYGHNGLSPAVAKAREEQLASEIAEIQRQIVKATNKRSLCVPKDEEEHVQHAEEIVEVAAPRPRLRRRPSVVISPHDVGIGGQEVVIESMRHLAIPDEENPAGEQSDQDTCSAEVNYGRKELSPGDAKAREVQLEAEIAEIQNQIAKAKARRSSMSDAKIPRKALVRDDSVTSRTTKSTNSDVTEQPFIDLLGARATMRLSIVTAKAVKKLRQRLVSAQLRQRLKEHSKQKELQAKVPCVINVGKKPENPWDEIISAISTAAKNLKPTPREEMRDSSTWVNNDHPYMRELREVQAEVLPMWRKETYDYWI